MEKLPVEMLAKIVRNIENYKDLLTLRLTNKALKLSVDNGNAHPAVKCFITELSLTHFVTVNEYMQSNYLVRITRPSLKTTSAREAEGLIILKVVLYFNLYNKYDNFRNDILL